MNRSFCKLTSIAIILLSINLLFPKFSSAQNFLSDPQKIVIDIENERLLVSNYNSGNIVSIDKIGIQSVFKFGANFIDGLDIVGNRVYGVGDARKILAYNLTTKVLEVDVSIPGNAANYLSSITSDSAGHLFVSCPQENAIYRFRISDNSFWIFAKDNGLNKPNGILLEKDNNRLVIIDDSPGNSIIHAISLADSSVTNLITTDLNRPDGIVRDKNGNYYIGGYYLPGIYKLNSDLSTAPTLFFEGSNFVYPTYDEGDNSLLVTLYEDNSWKRIPLETTEINDSELINEFMLEQNYPNPFNPSTKISFRIKETNNTNLSIYSISGEKISELVNKKLRAGNYNYNFNSSNLPSGIYFYSLITGDISETKKMILLK